MGSAASIPQKIQQLASPSRAFVAWALSERNVETCVTTRINTQRHILRRITEFALPEKRTVKNYRRLKRLAKGSYGVVDLVYKRKTRELCVMKIKKQQDITINKGDYRHHPNLVTLSEFFVEGKYAIMILEYCDGGNLQRRIKKAKLKNRQFHEHQVMDWCIQLIFALEYLHDKKMLHGNITTRNIYLCHKNKILKLGSPDIGSEQKKREKLGMCINQDSFRDFDVAPEVFHGKDCSLANDVWALGLVLGEMMLLQHPFHAKDLFAFMSKIQKNDRHPIPDVYSADIRGLVDLLLTTDCTERPSMKDIVEHAYVQQHLKGFIQRCSEDRRCQSVNIRAKEDAKRKEQQSLKYIIEMMGPEIDHMKKRLLAFKETGETTGKEKQTLQKEYKALREQHYKAVCSLRQSRQCWDGVDQMSKVECIARRKSLLPSHGK